MNKQYIYLILAAVVLIGGFTLYKNSPLAVSAYVSTDVAGLPEAKPSETVELKDGDTYTLTASYVAKNINGIEYRMLGYNGSVPGPLFKIPQGAQITINFKNDTDMPTLLHSHGVRMDNQFDGSQTSQKEIAPGGRFAYTLKFPDAGFYWYHPHVREDFEQALGLYGGFLVVPNDTAYWDPVNQEVPLFLGDVLIQNNSINFSKTAADHTLMGRYGNVMLVNGQSDYKLSVDKGEVVRFYITNAANARPFKFAIEGAKLKLVGGDNGAYEKDSWQDSVTIGPSERAIIEVLFDKSGTFAIQNKTPDQTYSLGTVVVSNILTTTTYAPAFNQLKTHQETVQSIDPFRSAFDKAPDKHISLTINMSGAPMQMQKAMGGEHMMPDGTMMGGSMMSTSPDGIEWDDSNKFQGSMSTTQNVQWKITDQDTGAVNSDIKWTFTKGQPVKIQIYNDPHSMHPMQHQIHFHGNRFLVLDMNGVKNIDLVWKDTVTVPSGATVEILLDPSNPGLWMAHCHIAEHLEDGMMFTYTVQ